jgi:hypothetical protein
MHANQKTIPSTENPNSALERPPQLTSTSPLAHGFSVRGLRRRPSGSHASGTRSARGGYHHREGTASKTGEHYSTPFPWQTCIVSSSVTLYKMSYDTEHVGNAGDTPKMIIGSPRSQNYSRTRPSLVSIHRFGAQRLPRPPNLLNQRLTRRRRCSTISINWSRQA